MSRLTDYCSVHCAQPATLSTPHNLAASTSSADSPTLGDKPARPPKAAHRLSTGSIYQQQQGDVPTMTDAEAGSAAPVSSVERVDDAAAGRDLASSDEPALLPATSVGPPLGVDQPAVDGSKRSSAADGFVSAQTGESSTAKVATAPNSTSIPIPTSSPTTAAKPTAPSSSTAPVSRSAPAAASRTSPPSLKKKRKGGLSSLFACLPCFGSTGHDDTPANPSASTSRPSAAATRVGEQEKRNVAVPDSKDTSTSSSKEKDAAAAAAAAPVTSEKPPTSIAEATTPTTVATAAPVEPESAITPTPTEPLVAASSGDAAAAQLAPPPTSAPAQRGVMLSQEETEGVTSGAVVPPGQAPTGALGVAAAAAAAGAGVGAAAVAAPKSKRKRSGKHPNSNSATDGIITSVPEPGAPAGPRGGALFARQAGDETSSDDISSDEDDDEENDDDDDEDEEEEDEEAGLIARGGVGIPIGEDGLPHPLLDDLSDDLKGRKCLVLDLDETLVHSSFKVRRRSLPPCPPLQ